ncbi:S41 family peptidase [Rapidithrix thailandica]|uniref:S41 family peptidase n=1 Tax=Rapidithrix thailandica TaxID=413964 RepID=A0AAW9S8W2_9BACT
MKFKKLSLGVVVFTLISSLVAFSPHDKYFEIAKNIDIFVTLYQEVNKFYVDDVNPTDLMNSGINSMLNTLDPYTDYIPEDEIEDYRTMTTGEYGGVGIMIGNRNSKIMILMASEGFAADRAGLEIGDELIKIDEVDVERRNIDDISKLLKGQSGSEVNLTVRRFGHTTPLTFHLKREKIQLSNVPYFGMVTEDIGLIQLTDFTRNASKEVATALNKLKDQGAKKVILDLRSNPGGLLSEAINVSNVFLPKGLEIVSTKGKIKDWNRTNKALNSPVDTEIPLAVLINGHSASAAEIVSGVIQDYDRGVLVGRRSFGKGLVQATRSLSYNSKLKVTVAKYYIPSGRCIQEIDYSHKSKDGSPEKIPDSLRVAFKTQNGRTVYDGGGVSPDLRVSPMNYATITMSLLNRGLIFNYATEYKFKHEQIPPAKDFSLTDAEFEEFVEWLNDKEYDYRTEVEKSYDKLVISAKAEKYYDDIQNEIQALKQKIFHNKESDLYNFKKEIKRELEKEICSRYYLKNGRIEVAFDHDHDVLTAVAVLNDNDRYGEILAKH